MAKIHETRALEAQLRFQVLFLTVLFQNYYDSIKYMIKKYTHEVADAAVHFSWREKMALISHESSQISCVTE